MKIYLTLTLIALLLLLSACTSPFTAQNNTNASQNVVVQAEPAAPGEENDREDNASEEGLPGEEIAVEEAPVLESLENRTIAHYVSMVESGFEVPEITIKVGETVAWKNEREGHVSKAMILGTKQCQPIRSGIFLPGEVFRWTFTEAETCVIVDGIYTTQTMKVVVKP